MKKLIMYAMALATLIASSANIQNLSNKKISENNWYIYQFRVVINNQTNNVGINATDSFYLDLSFNGVTVDDNNFVNIRKYPQKYNDTFVTEPGSVETIYSLFVNPDNVDNFVINFNFGILYWVVGIWYHSQIATSSGPITMNMEMYSLRDYDNGLELYFDATGGQGTNTGTQSYHFYNFTKIFIIT